jgi:hypothetical protein
VPAACAQGRYGNKLDTSSRRKLDILATVVFYGWGTKTKYWPLPDGRTLTAVWQYVHAYWFPIAYSAKWYVSCVNPLENREISYDEVRGLFPTEPPKLSVWDRYGLLFLFGGIALLIAFLIWKALQ